MPSTRTVDPPASFTEAAETLRSATEAGLTVRARGGGTKLGWGAAVPDPDVELSTRRLDRVVEHNAGDLTAVLEAGVRLADAQAVFAAAGQMLALDPPLGAEAAATVGGIVATGDGGPLRHRYGGVRDLLLGITVALADGTVAKSGGKVIKNVAGYDLAKLFAGSFGTLGVVLQVVVRLHPLPERTATVVGRSDDAAALARSALRLAREPLELEALDVTWEDARGALLARVAGAAAAARAEDIASGLRRDGLDVEEVADDDAMWEAQRSRQRTADGVVVRVSGLPAGLERALRVVARLGPSLAGRVGGLWWLRLPPDHPLRLAAAIGELRRQLAPAPCVVLDAPPGVRERVDVWGVQEEPLLRLSRRVKDRFDPHGACNPGLFMGGL